MAAVGDEVVYVPHVGHALDQTPDGRFVYRWVTKEGNRRGPEAGTKLTDKELHARIAVHGGRGGKGIHDGVEPSYPVVFFQATVRGLSGSGGDSNLLDLDALHPMGHILHLDGVLHDAMASPHTWHRLDVRSTEPQPHTTEEGK